MTWAGNVAPMWTEVHIVFWCGDRREKNHLEELGFDGIIISIWICKKLDRGARTVLVWLRIGTTCGNLWMRWWTFAFHKMQEISSIAQYLLSSEEWLYSSELASCLVSSYLSDTMNQLLRLHEMQRCNRALRLEGWRGRVLADKQTIQWCVPSWFSVSAGSVSVSW